MMTPMAGQSLANGAERAIGRRLCPVALCHPTPPLSAIARGSRLKATLHRFFIEEWGTNTLLFALFLPVILSCVGFGFDYATLTRAKQALQEAADAGALAGAKELSLSDTSKENINAIVQSVVDAYVQSNLSSRMTAGATTSAGVLDNPLRVEVAVTGPMKLLFPKGVSGVDANSVNVSSTAKVVGKPNICVLALEPSEIGALSMESSASLTGNNCSVFSNSTSSKGLMVRENSSLTATSICSAGGIDGIGFLTPAPFLDCPQFADPLAARPEPSYAGCNFNDTVISAETRILEPGVYCGGLRIEKSAVVSLNPGLYIIADGLFTVSSGAELKGDGASFFLGPKVWMFIGPDSGLSLAASKSGPLAGLLFFGSRSQSKLLTHTILSRNAQTLTGTIYFPQNSLIVDGEAQVGGTSAYTAIVARRLVLLKGPKLVLNSNYDQTDVPVPAGIRGAAQPVALMK